MPAPLERERKTFEEKKQELLANSAGKYVVIHGEDVAGIWDTQDDALRAV